MLQIPDDSPLSDRSLRNGMEHYDERIERWSKGKHTGQFVLYGIMPIELADQNDHTNNHWIYDPQYGTLHFWNNDIRLPEIYEVLRDMLIQLSNHRPIYFDFGRHAYEKLIASTKLS
ncbi:MAG: hypothetical protein Phyf2KO_18220 [Phycisphaerales bacterium]